MLSDPKTRAEIDERSKWDLSKIFTDNEQWKAALEAAKMRVNEFAAFAGRLDESAETLQKALDTFYSAMQQVELVYLYAQFNKDGDNGDATYQAMQDNALRLSVELDTVSAFMSPEILAIPEKRFEELVNAPQLKTYEHVLREIVRGRAHTLDEKGERMLAMLGEAAQTPSQSFSMLESVDMSFPTITDGQGQQVELTHGNFGVFRESSNRSVRREAFEKYFGEFKRYGNTFAAMYGGAVKFDEFYSKIRSFDSALSAALFSGNIPTEVYRTLVAAVNDNLDVMQKYLALRSTALGVDDLHMYDLYCPMVSDVDFSFDFSDACEMVKSALKPLGDKYAKLLERAFDERWIDIYENKGKTTGAFSCGVYGAHPYVLLNYQGRLDDVFTLAHELGHAMHSYLSDEAQPYHEHDYSIFVAEVASTVNEVLLLKYMLKTEDDVRRRAYLLNHFLESFRTTLYRQVLFAEFELKTHEMAAEGEPLTFESLNALYGNLNRRYYSSAICDELDCVEWARIPHFYNAFYVYQYATGFSSAVAIASSIFESGDANEYLSFLSMGGSDYPLEELKRAGVDLTSPAPVQAALNVFSDTIEQLKVILEDK